MIVEDSRATVVLGGDHAVADGVPMAGDDELVRAETPLVLQELASALVEVADVIAARRDHQAVTVGAGPVVDQRVARGRGAWADGDLAAGSVGARPLLDLAAAQRVQRLAVPRLVLAADLVKIAGR